MKFGESFSQALAKGGQGRLRRPVPHPGEVGLGEAFEAGEEQDVDRQQIENGEADQDQVDQDAARLHSSASRLRL
jgi:hypothetical protein